MRRPLLIAALALAAVAGGARAASAAVSDAERRCELGEEQLSMLSEARFTALLDAVVEASERCVDGLGDPADCHIGDTDGGPAPASSWAPWSRDHWVAPSPPWLAPPDSRAVRPAAVCLVACRGYARELERPPQG